MKKIVLDLDALEVESFETEKPAGAELGAVAGYQLSGNPACPTYDPLNVRCAFSRPLEPGNVCTPVCIASIHCVITADPAGCG